MSSMSVCNKAQSLADDFPLLWIKVLECIAMYNCTCITRIRIFTGNLTWTSPNLVHLAHFNISGILLPVVSGSCDLAILNHYRHLKMTIIFNFKMHNEGLWQDINYVTQGPKPVACCFWLFYCIIFYAGSASKCLLQNQNNNWSYTCLIRAIKKVRKI